jgi:hypothetical protein
MAICHRTRLRRVRVASSAARRISPRPYRLGLAGLIATLYRARKNTAKSGVVLVVSIYNI